jgi:hypothetical protein
LLALRTLTYLSIITKDSPSAEMKQFKWTYYSFLGLLASSLISSYLASLFLCVLLVIWVRSGDFKRKIDFLLQNWHYPAMSLVLLLAILNLTPQKLTIEYGITLFLAVAAPLILPTLKSLNFTYNKRGFSQFFVWMTLVTSILVPFFLICAETFNWNILFLESNPDSFKSKLKMDLLTDFNSVGYYLIFLMASTLILEFFNLRDSRRKNVWKILQLSILCAWLLLLMQFFPNFLPFILVFSAFGLKRIQQKGDPTQKMAWAWFGLAFFFVLLDLTRSTLFPHMSSDMSYTNMFICSNNNCFKTIFFLILPMVLTVVHAYKQRNLAFLIWLISVSVIIVPYAQYAIDYVLTLSNVVLISIFLPFMNMLRSENR